MGTGYSTRTLARARVRPQVCVVDELRISELFVSLQGEGASIGVPATFLRLGDCNLNCQYCDTRYTWDWQRHIRRDQLTVETIFVAAARIRRFAPRRLVITGGEPLLQQAALEELITELREFFVEIETNGTLAPSQRLSTCVGQWNVSPKLSSSSVDLPSRIKPDALSAFRDTQRSWLKFVVCGPSDLPEIKELVVSLHWPPDKVILMPEAATAAQLAERSIPVAEAALEYGYRFSTRLHVALWNNERAR